MKKVIEDLFIGTVADYEQCKNENDFNFLACCKEPIHREVVGYTGRACDKENPEYLFAYRDNLLALNLVDANSSAFFSDIIINEAINFISKNIVNKKVLVFCNQSISRSPSIVFLYLASIGKYQNKTYEEAKEMFKLLYPDFNPSKGINDFIIENWNCYSR